MNKNNKGLFFYKPAGNSELRARFVRPAGSGDHQDRGRHRNR